LAKRPKEDGVVSERERRMAVLGPHVFDGVPLAPADAGVPRRTAARWLLAYTADGSTARSGRSDRTSRRRIPVELVNLIEGMALRRPPPKTAQVHREAVRIADERGWPAPSYPVVYRIIAGLDRGLVSLAHKGDAGYRNDFDLVLRRESANLNDLWQADHTQLDVMVLDESDRPARPRLTVILDDKSRAVAGYTVFLGDPTALQTALALRQAIWRGRSAGCLPRSTATTARTSPATTWPRHVRTSQCSSSTAHQVCPA